MSAHSEGVQLLLNVSFTDLSFSPANRGSQDIVPPLPIPTRLTSPPQETSQTHQQRSYESHDHVELQVRVIYFFRGVLQFEQDRKLYQRARPLVTTLWFFLSFFNRKPWNSKSSPQLLDRRVAPEESRDDGLRRWTLRNLQTQNSRLSSSVSATDVKCNLKNLSSDRLWVTLNTGSYSYEPQIWAMRTDGSPSEPQSRSCCCRQPLIGCSNRFDLEFKC